MKKSLVFFENDLKEASFDLAELGVSMGYDCHLILNNNTIVPNKNYPFTITKLKKINALSIKKIVHDISQKTAIAGLASVFGFFIEGGLLPAIVSDIAKEMGLKHNPSEALLKSSNKFLMRRCLQDKGVYTTRFALVENIESLVQACNYVKFPLILKPVIGICSSFIYKCHDFPEAKKAFMHYIQNANKGFYSELFKIHSFENMLFRPFHQLLAEEFINGPELSIELLCTDNEITPLLVHDKLDVQQKEYSFFENLLITPPVNIAAPLIEKTKQYAVDIAKAIGLKNCFCHAEIRIHKGQPAIIEINPRVGGMRVIDTLQSHLNISHSDILLRMLTGKNFALPDIDHNFDDYLGMCAVYPEKSGMLSDVLGIETAQKITGVEGITQHVPNGHLVSGDFEEVFVVSAWFRGKSATEIRNIDKQIKQCIKLKVDPL